jgi:hypothetical protein
MPREICNKIEDQMTQRDVVFVYIDSCAVDRFAENDTDPVDALQGAKFKIAYTPDLEAEYKRALEKPGLCPKVLKLMTKLLGAGVRRGLFGFDGQGCSGWGEGVWPSPQQIDVKNSIPTKARTRNLIPKNRTDAYLVAMAQDAIVITDNFKDQHWRKPPSGSGRVIFWRELNDTLRQGNDLAKAISDLYLAPSQAAPSHSSHG